MIKISFSKQWGIDIISEQESLNQLIFREIVTPYLNIYAKISSRWFKNFNMKSKAMKVLEETA